MPIYEYRCKDGHTFEVIQRMTDEPVAECEVCGAPVERVFHPIAVHFKGSGFYSTDYGAKKDAKAGAEDSSGAKGESGDSGADSGGDKGGGDKGGGDKGGGDKSSGSGKGSDSTSSTGSGDRAKTSSAD